VETPALAKIHVLPYQAGLQSLKGIIKAYWVLFMSLKQTYSGLSKAFKKHLKGL
jgi:hypothetical protein